MVTPRHVLPEARSMETLASSNREHLNGIESIVYVVFAIISALILLGGLFLGVRSGRWDQAMAKR
jgi:hypothetical protein